jgi:Tol biopolymer transport system component
MLKNITLIITILFILNCGEEPYNNKVEHRYSNPIGAINITKNDKLEEIGKVHWSNDGSYILYAVDDYDRKNEDINFLYDFALRYIKGEYPNIYSPKYYAYTFEAPPVVSHDGIWLVYTGELPDEDGVDILRVNINNPEGEPERLTYMDHTNCWGRVSSDDTWLAFFSDREPHFPCVEIYIMKFEPENENNQPYRITYYNDGSSQCYNLLWSPDGEWLYYTHSGYFMSNKIYKIKPFEGMNSIEIINIFGGNSAIPIDISPDGKWMSIEYFNNNSNEMYIGYISSDSGEQEIHDFFPPLEWGCDCWGASFSPDGKWIAFVSEMENKEGETDIFLYPFNQ